MLILSFLLSLAFAETHQLRNLREKSFIRDSTYCRFEGKTLKIEIRGSNKFTESKEKGYGEDLLYYVDQTNQSRVLPLNREGLETYRFFKGGKGICSKSASFKVGDHLLAILFQQENKPFKDKLSFAVFDFQKMLPKQVLDTNLLNDEVDASSDGFVFNVYSDKIDNELGKVIIKGSQYMFQDRDFVSWKKFTISGGVEAAPSVTYDKFTWKSLFSSEKDFLETSGWDPEKKAFAATLVYFAVNPQTKKECVLLSPKKISVTGKETDWKCN